jgi:cytochrome c
MTPFRLSIKAIPVVAVVSVLTLSACSEEAKAPLSDEQISAVKEQLAPVASVAVAAKNTTDTVKPPAQAAPEPAPAASAPAAHEAAASTPEAPAAVPEESTTTEAPATAEATPAEAAPAAAAPDALALATSSACMACHQIDVKLVGPSYKEVAAKYTDDPAALEMLVAKVKAGGTGVWGQIPMPPNGHVSDADITTIVTWVLTQ